jgi:hypothetical protein
MHVQNSGSRFAWGPKQQLSCSLLATIVAILFTQLGFICLNLLSNSLVYLEGTLHVGTSLLEKRRDVTPPTTYKIKRSYAYFLYK